MPFPFPPPPHLVLRNRPAALIALGHGENSLFALCQQFGAGHDGRGLSNGRPPPDLQVVVADVRDRPRLEAVFRKYRPELVFHAAVHKHVPLMEANPEDAVSNNVLGTRNLVALAEAHGVRRFVLISSDKAVNPANVMGATRRVAEMIVAQAALRCGRPFVSVRFGNVLATGGSPVAERSGAAGAALSCLPWRARPGSAVEGVVPLFQQQIAAGGPVTVTHPEVRRYFMTIP